MFLHFRRVPIRSVENSTIQVSAFESDLTLRRRQTLLQNIHPTLLLPPTASSFHQKAVINSIVVDVVVPIFVVGVIIISTF